MRKAAPGLRCSECRWKRTLTSIVRLPALGPREPLKWPTAYGPGEAGEAPIVPHESACHDCWNCLPDHRQRLRYMAQKDNADPDRHAKHHRGLAMTASNIFPWKSLLVALRLSW